MISSMFMTPAKSNFLSENQISYQNLLSFWLNAFPVQKPQILTLEKEIEFDQKCYYLYS